HRGNISIGGTTGSSDRSLADYFNVYIGPDGLANIMYTDNANATGTETSHIDFVRQNGGPVALTHPTFPSCLPIPVLTSVVSRKGHSTAGPFDISLPLPPSTSPRAVECRSGGATNDYQLVFSFTNNLTSVTGASVSSHNPAS